VTDQELRSLVREIVARRLAERAQQPSAPQATVHIGRAARIQHPSHDIYLTVVNTGEACVIEPDAPCNHCDYCKSHGH